MVGFSLPPPSPLKFTTYKTSSSISISLICSHTEAKAKLNTCEKKRVKLAKELHQQRAENENGICLCPSIANISTISLLPPLCPLFTATCTDERAVDHSQRAAERISIATRRAAIAAQNLETENTRRDF